MYFLFVTAKVLRVRVEVQLTEEFGLVIVIWQCVVFFLKEVRLATVLRELPFTVAFDQRIIVFQNLVQRDKQENQVL